MDISTRAPALSSSVCNTTACITASKYVLSRVNLSIDPCSDFYQYTCGSWINSPAVKANYDQGIITRESDLLNLANQALETQILEGTYEDFKKRVKPNATGFHLDDQEDTDKSNFELYKSYYDVCKDTNMYHVNQFTPIYQDIVMLQKEIVPVNATASQYGRAMAFFIQQSISILPFDMSVSVSFADYNVPQVVITGSQALAKYTYNREDIVSRLVQVVGQSNDASAQKASRQSGLEFWSNSTISAAVDSHQKVVGLIQSTVAKFASNLTYNPASVTNGPWIPLDVVQQALPAINISTLMTTLSSKLKTDAVANLHFRTVPAYLSDINNLFATESENTLRNFFVVQYIVDKYPHLAPFPELLVTEKPINISNSTRDSLQAYCSRDTNAHFAYGLSRYFGLETFGGENDRQKTLEFIETIREALLTRISNNSWLDDQTKQAAIQKMKLTKTGAAYKVSDPDWRDPSLMKAYYGDDAVDTRSYYHAKKTALTGTSQRMWEHVADKSTLTMWDLLSSPGLINAFYWPQINTIAILLGSLTSPMYDNGFPEYLNFGAVGSTIGHEFLHGLDTRGRIFNGTGHIESWWSSGTAKEYEERQKCFVDDYSKISLTDEKGNQVFVNGQQTLNENIADIGGLSVALDAYRVYVNKERQGQPEPSLPGLEHLTPDQMFYIASGLQSCESIPPNQARFYEMDEHAPNFARVNPVVQNNADFATVFNCPVDSPMNKRDKCYLW